MMWSLSKCFTSAESALDEDQRILGTLCAKAMFRQLRCVSNAAAVGACTREDLLKPQGKIMNCINKQKLILCYVLPMSASARVDSVRDGEKKSLKMGWVSRYSTPVIIRYACIRERTSWRDHKSGHEASLPGDGHQRRHCPSEKACRVWRRVLQTARL